MGDDSPSLAGHRPSLVISGVRLLPQAARDSFNDLADRFF